MPCPECKKEISTLAETCPHCGAPTPRKRATEANKEPGTKKGAIHGQGEGCFLQTMNCGCALVVGFILLVIIGITLAVFSSS